MRNLAQPTSIKSRKLFRSARYAPCMDKGVFLVKMLPNPTFSFGIVATKKIGGAVQRNFIKRRIKNAFFQTSKTINTKPRVAVIFIAKKDAGKSEFKRILEACGEVMISLTTRP